MDEAQPLAFHDPAAPERLVGIRDRALAPVLQRHQRDLQRAVVCGLPPVEFLDLGDAVLAEPRLQPQRHQEARAAAASLPAASPSRGRGGRSGCARSSPRRSLAAPARRSAAARFASARRRKPARRTPKRSGRRAHSSPPGAPAPRRGRSTSSKDCWLARAAPQIRFHRRQIPASRRRLGNAFLHLFPLPRPEALLFRVRIVVPEAVCIPRRLRMDAECNESETGDNSDHGSGRGQTETEMYSGPVAHVEIRRRGTPGRPRFRHNRSRDEHRFARLIT